VVPADCAAENVPFVASRAAAETADANGAPSTFVNTDGMCGIGGGELDSKGGVSDWTTLSIALRATVSAERVSGFGSDGALGGAGKIVTLKTVVAVVGSVCGAAA